MVLFFTTTLAISIVGLTMLIVVKRWEMQTGRAVLGRLRPTIGEFFHRGLVWVEHAAPALVRSGSHRLYKRTLTLAQSLIARAVLWLEQGLEKLLHGVRRATEAPRGEGEASAFLKEVGEYKKKLSQKDGEEAINE